VCIFGATITIFSDYENEDSGVGYPNAVYCEDAAGLSYSSDRMDDFKGGTQDSTATYLSHISVQHISVDFGRMQIDGMIVEILFRELDDPPDREESDAASL